jgi:hypothetical protein
VVELPGRPGKIVQAGKKFYDAKNNFTPGEKFFGPRNNFMSGEIISHSGRKSPGAKFDFKTPGRNLLEQRFDFKIRGRNFMLRKIISKLQEKIS